MINKQFRMPAAVHVFLRQGEQILLLRRFNTGYEDGRYSVIAGHLDGGEEIRAAAREAREEAGILIDPAAVVPVGVMYRRSHKERIDFSVAVDRWSGEVRNAEPERCYELRWATLAALPENTIPYVRQEISNYRASVWFDSFGW